MRAHNYGRMIGIQYSNVFDPPQYIQRARRTHRGCCSSVKAYGASVGKSLHDNSPKCKDPTGDVLVCDYMSILMG